MPAPRDAAATWRRNQLAITTAAFIGFMGFTLVMPFLPLYFRELGIEDVGAIAAWSGASLGITPAVTALCSPLWGALADRFGRKLMVARSLVSFVIVMSAMAFVTAPWQVFALRFLQGLFAGYGALTMAMIVESAPPDRVARAIGLVQTTQRLAPAVGPVIGGTLAQIVGLRQAFLVSAVFYVVALAIVLGMYREPDVARSRPAAGVRSAGWMAALMRLPNFPLLLGVVFGAQFADRSLSPILPVFVAELGTTDERVPLAAGLLFSAAALSGAVGHHLGGRLIDRLDPRRVIVIGASVAFVGLACGAAARSLGFLVVAMPLLGLGVGLITTAAYATASRVIPPGVEGRAFGVLSSASLTGLAVSPLFSGFIGGLSRRGVFVVDLVVVGALAIAVAMLMVRSDSNPDPAPLGQPG